MTFTVYEYEKADPATGDPIEPPIARTVAAFDTAVHLTPQTKYVAVTASAAAHLRPGSSASDLATAADYYMAENTNYRFAALSASYVSCTAA